MMIGCIIISSHKEWPGHGCMTVRGDAANELRVQLEDIIWTGRDMNIAMDGRYCPSSGIYDRISNWSCGRTVNDVVHEFSKQSNRNKRSRRRMSLLSSGWR